MKFNDEFKLNPLLCCGRDGGGPGEADGGGFGGFGGNDSSGTGGGSSGGSTDGGDDSNGANRASSGDPTSNGFGGTAEGIMGIVSANNPGFDAPSASDVTDVSTFESIASGLFSGFKGYVTGGIIGAITGLVSGAKQSEIDQISENLVNYGLSSEYADEVAEDLANAISSQATSDSSFDANSLGEDQAYDILASAIDTVDSTWSYGYSDEEGSTYSNGMPSNIPDDFIPGLEDYINGAQTSADRYQQYAQEIWDDYLEFEDTYTGEFKDARSEYDANLASMPSLTMVMPDSMGGASFGLAPVAHSSMYGDQFSKKVNAIGNEANTALAGIGSRDAVNNNMFNVGMTNLESQFLPTQTAIDLYTMERSGELGIQQAEAGKNETSTISSWAPVVGSILASDTGGKIISSVWDTVAGILA